MNLSDRKKVGYGYEFLAQIFNLNTRFFIFLLFELNSNPHLDLFELSQKKSNISYQCLVQISTLFDLSTPTQIFTNAILYISTDHQHYIYLDSACE